jgi:malate synthase
MLLDTTKPANITITVPVSGRMGEILTPEALLFLSELHARFEAPRQARLAARIMRQKEFDQGVLPDFLSQTQSVRDANWQIASIPHDLLDRRVEITGPVDRKMIINALNCGAKVFMADFEDANSPTFSNCIDGQINLRDRWAGTLSLDDPNTGKSYRLKAELATLIVRPRGWRLDERHALIDAKSMSGALFDFGLYMFHSAKAAIAAGSGPYFYLPKLESHLEARLWNEVFIFAQDYLNIPQGTIKATVLIETLPAAFEMDEIIYELKDHMAGLNCGRWDYIFSFIKTFAERPEFITPDRSTMVMGQAFLSAYSQALIKTCHRRGAFAMGGMAAQIPVKNNPDANAQAFARVKADKEREAGNGHDGTWVAHPDLVPVAMEVFDRLMPSKNQLHVLREDVTTTPPDLLKMHEGQRTEAGLRENIRVGIQYIEAWLKGRGAVPLYNLMEDAATAEISRTQVWQWIRHQADLDDGRSVTKAMVESLISDEVTKLRATDGFVEGRMAEALDLFIGLVMKDTCTDFLTVPAYERLN